MYMFTLMIFRSRYSTGFKRRGAVRVAGTTTRTRRKPQPCSYGSGGSDVLRGSCAQGGASQLAQQVRWHDMTRRREANALERTPSAILITTAYSSGGGSDLKRFWLRFLTRVPIGSNCTACRANKCLCRSFAVGALSLNFGFFHAKLCGKHRHLTSFQMPFLSCQRASLLTRRKHAS